MLAEGPSSLVQIPVPGEGLFPSIVILVVPEGIQMPDPAFATIGPTVLTTSTVMLLAVDPQPLAIVHVGLQNQHILSGRSRSSPAFLFWNKHPEEYFL